MVPKAQFWNQKTIHFLMKRSISCLWDGHIAPSHLFAADQLLVALIFFLETGLRNGVCFLLPSDLGILYSQGLLVECNSLTLTCLVESKCLCLPPNPSEGSSEKTAMAHLPTWPSMVHKRCPLLVYTKKCPYYLKETLCISPVGHISASIPPPQERTWAFSHRR